MNATVEKSQIHENLIEKNTDWMQFAEATSRDVRNKEHAKFNGNVHHTLWTREKAPRLVKMIENFNSLPKGHEGRKLIMGVFHEWFGITPADIINNDRIHVGFLKGYFQANGKI